jgi:hypothetical protein
MSKSQKGTCTLFHYIFKKNKVQLITLDWFNLHIKKVEVCQALPLVKYLLLISSAIQCKLFGTWGIP